MNKADKELGRLLHTKPEDWWPQWMKDAWQKDFDSKLAINLIKGGRLGESNAEIS